MTKRLANSILAASLCCLSGLVHSTASAQGQLEGAGIPYSGKIGALVKAPKGWIFDSQSGVAQDLHCVMYPQGTSWRTAGEVIYVSFGEIVPGKTLADFIEARIAELRKTSPRLESFELKPILLLSGQRALVRRLALDQLGNSECFACAQLGSSVAVFVFSCRSAEGYAKGIDAFNETVAAAGLIAMSGADGAPPGNGESGRPFRTPTGYSHWAQYKPGAFVTFKYTMTSARTSGECLKTIKLKEVTPGFVRLAYQEAASKPGAAPSAYYDHQEVDFGEAEEEFTRESPVESLLNYHIFDALDDVRARTVDSGTEEVELKGRKFLTVWTKLELESEGLVTTMSFWRCEGVPGGLWRFVREYTGAASSREEVVVADFAAPAASPEETSKLRAGREPVTIEVPAEAYLRARCRLPERLMNLGPGLFKSRGDSSWPPNMSPGDLLQALDLMKVEFEADRQRIFTELGPQGSAMLVPVLDLYRDILSLEIKIGERWAEIEKRGVSFDDKAEAEAFFRALTEDYRGQMQSLASKIYAAVRALGDISLKFTKKPDPGVR